MAQKRWLKYVKTPEKRFWALVDRTAGPDACWPWKRKTKLRYPTFRLRKDDKYQPSNRVAWILTFGSIPKGQEVCHACDNTQCVNPKHLFIGTHAQNMLDAKNKKRLPGSASQKGKYGSSHNSSKLIEKDVKAIRKAWRPWDRSCSQRVLAKLFGVAPTTIQAILERRTWPHI